MQEDKLAMAHGIEARAPFIDDISMVELACTLPTRFKFNKGIDKFLIREASKKYLPVDIVQRKKMPFQEPSNYSTQILTIFYEHFTEIKQSYFYKLLFNKDYRKEDFNVKEAWWLISGWRFEVNFPQTINLRKDKVSNNE